MTSKPTPNQTVEAAKTKQIHKKHQGRTRFSTPEKIYPLSRIQNAEQALLWISQLDYLTSSQLAKLLFWGEPSPKTQIPRSLSAAQKAVNEMCLRRLKDHGFIKVRRVTEETGDTFTTPEINFLTPKGVDFLNERLEDRGTSMRVVYNPDLSRGSLYGYSHSIKCHTAIANLIGSMRQQRGQPLLVMGNRSLTLMIRSGDGSTLLNDIEPDALIVMRFPDKIRVYFLEFDTGKPGVSSRARSSFDNKIPKYGDYFKNRFRDDPLLNGYEQPQVLVVTSGIKRAENLKEATFRAGGLRSYWFTDLASTDPSLGLATREIWIVPTLEGKQSLLPISL